MEERKLVKKLENKLKRCQNTCQSFRQRYILAKKITKSKGFEIVTDKLTRAAKIFFTMQVNQSGKHRQGRRFTPEELVISLSLYKTSPKGYRMLSQLCSLPSSRTLQNLLQKVDLRPGIN